MDNPILTLKNPLEAAFDDIVVPTQDSSVSTTTSTTTATTIEQVHSLQRSSSRGSRQEARRSRTIPVERERGITLSFAQNEADIPESMQLLESNEEVNIGLSMDYSSLLEYKMNTLSDASKSSMLEDFLPSLATTTIMYKKMEIEVAEMTQPVYESMEEEKSVNVMAPSLKMDEEPKSAMMADKKMKMKKRAKGKSMKEKEKGVSRKDKNEDKDMKMEKKRSTKI